MKLFNDSVKSKLNQVKIRQPKNDSVTKSIGKCLWHCDIGIGVHIFKALCELVQYYLVQKLWRSAMLTLPGAAAFGQGEIPGVHHRARSQQRLRPVGLLDPGEERVAFHPGAKENRHHCRGLCAALTWEESNGFVSQSLLWHWTLRTFFFRTPQIHYVNKWGRFFIDYVSAKTVIDWLDCTSCCGIFFLVLLLFEMQWPLSFFHAHDDVHVWTVATLLFPGKQWSSLENQLDMFAGPVIQSLYYAHDVWSVFSNKWHVYLYRHQTERLSPLAPLISERVCVC